MTMVYDIRKVVRINEDIKEVIATARLVYFTALNAMLVARRAGERSAGFGVVSAQLRAFSHKLEEIMNELGKLVVALLNAIARECNYQRELRLLQVAAQAGRAAQVMQAATCNMELKLTTLRDATAITWKKLARQISLALRLCTTGATLSRSGRIEAVYGGDMTAMLNQVSSQAEDAVSRTVTILKSLCRQVTL